MSWAKASTRSSSTLTDTLDLHAGKGTISSAAMRRVALAVACSACAADVTTTQQAATVCGGSATVNGMDVAGPYDEVTDWAAAKASGIDFAFIRVSRWPAVSGPWFDD